MPTDRYLSIIINLENQNMLDDQTSTTLKNLILEENVEIFRLINGFIAKIIDDQELCSKLIRLAQMQMPGMDRLTSPVKNKNKLI